MNRNAATAQAIRRSNRVIVSEADPGGPVSEWTTIGIEKPVARARIAAPWTPWRMPIPTLKLRKRSIRLETSASDVPGKSSSCVPCAVVIVMASRRSPSATDRHV